MELCIDNQRMYKNILYRLFNIDDLVIVLVMYLISNYIWKCLVDEVIFQYVELNSFVMQFYYLVFIVLLRNY